jgi:serine/threonine protein kinase
VSPVVGENELAMELRSRVLAERYEVEDLLGRGGMAEVYRGRDRTLARTVAIKVLARHLVADPPFVTRFQREAQAAARLSHPNLVSVFDTGSDGDFHYIVMEYVPGRTLAEVLRERGKLPLPRACRIAATVAAAFSAAHDAGIVHRDVKPGNVMLTGRGEVKLTDLGIARALGHESLTQTATVLGTAPYFSPEQARGEAVDARSDLYSLGCLLYEMLTGRPPFTGDSALAVAYKHVNEEPIPPSELDPHIPEDVEAVVLRSLAKDPDRRYKRARDMREDLEQIVAGPAISPGSKDSTEVMPEPSSTLTLPGPPVPSVPRGPLTSGEPRLARVPRPALAGAAILIVLALATGLGAAGRCYQPPAKAPLYIKGASSYRAPVGAGHKQDTGARQALIKSAQ